MGHSLDKNPVGTGRIYLASRFARRDEMRTIAWELESCGFEVTSRWLESPAALTSSDLEPEGVGADLASMDLEDLRRSDVCLAFTEASDHPRPGRGGRHTELGIAIGLGLGIMLIGPREHVFHALPFVRHFSEWPSARQALLASLARPALLAPT